MLGDVYFTTQNYLMTSWAAQCSFPNPRQAELEGLHGLKVGWAKE